jgi:two-component system OmpR family response regulator
VDDEEDVRDVLSEALRGAGYEVRSFGDGSDALEAIEGASEPPRLVILDLLLPHLDGREVLKRLRAGRRVPDVPVLVMTGAEVTERHFEPLRVSAVLEKPIPMDELLEAIAKALGRRKSRKKPPS